MSEPLINPLECWSEDRRFGVQIGAAEMTKILGICTESGHDETGGILIGYYSDRHYCAIVTEITGPGADSRSGRTWFKRGAARLGALLRGRWLRGRGYYLGEWHFHPAGAPTTSGTDSTTMWRIAADPEVQCERPLLLIVGGAVPDDWHVSANVFTAGGDVIPLLAVG